MSKKHIILHKDYFVSVDDSFCYYNDIKQEQKRGETNIPFAEIKDGLVKKFYDSFFKHHFKNIVVFLAAGASMDNGENKGKTRIELWDYCKNEIEGIIRKVPDLKSKPFYDEKDIESLLSHIILYEKLNGEIKENDNHLRKAIEKKIKEACSLSLDETAPHLTFLNKITSRKPSDSRVQLFTTNYDTLFEQAANKGGFIIMDGFSFTNPRVFSGRNFDYDIVYREKTRIKNEESFISKVFHLYKLHGSLNWEKNGTNTICQKENIEIPLIIYPASDKYESSYEQPYFEMMSRFQQSLRKDDLLLIVIGFGFQDKHIQNVIIEAVDQNPSFQLVVVNYNSKGGIDTDSLPFVEKEGDKTKVKRNVTIIFDTFKNFTQRLPENKTYVQNPSNINDSAI